MRNEISLHVIQKRGRGSFIARGVVFNKKKLKMSMIQVISHSGSGIAADRTPFYGIKLPSEVKKLVQLSKTVDHATLRKILKCMDHIPHFRFHVVCCMYFCRCCDACGDGRGVRGSVDSSTRSKVLTGNSQSVVCRNAITADVSTSYTRT